MDTIIFDLDGTLIDTSEGIINCADYAMEALNLTKDEPYQLELLIGPPLKKALMDSFKISEQEAVQAVQKYRERYREKGIYECRPYEGITDLIRKLKASGKQLGVATSKSEPFAKRMLKDFGLMDLFDVVVGESMDNSLTQKTHIIRAVMDQLRSARLDEIIMVGDREFDVLGAKACGIACVGVEYGFAVPGELASAGADYIVGDMAELGELLLSL